MKRFNTQRLHPEYFDASGHIIQKKQVIYGNEMDGKGTFLKHVYFQPIKADNCPFQTIRSLPGIAAK